MLRLQRFTHQATATHPILTVIITVPFNTREVEPPACRGVCLVEGLSTCFCMRYLVVQLQRITEITIYQAITALHNGFFYVSAYWLSVHTGKYKSHLTHVYLTVLKQIGVIV